VWSALTGLNGSEKGLDRMFVSDELEARKKAGFYSFLVGHVNTKGAKGSNLTLNPWSLLAKASLVQDHWAF
jgi:hypothetical protein